MRCGLNKKLAKTGLLIVLILWILSACIPEAVFPSTEPPDAIYTSAAQTMGFELTLAAGQTAVAQLTDLARRPSPTIELPTPTPLPTQTPTLPALPSPTPTVVSVARPCDAASFLEDVTVPPNTSFSPGDPFLKTWRIVNTGSCTWAPDYTLAFSGGDPLGGPLLVNVPEIVPPDEALDLSIALTAPVATGQYQGYWVLRNANNDPIEVAPEPLGALWVQIQVQGALSSRTEFDLTTNYCSAQWQSNAGDLACPGESDSPDGSVILQDNPRLESRNENEPALWVRPGEGKNGWITGEYPPFRIRNDDHFISEVGCLRNSPQCELRFELNYRTADGNIENLDSWYETEDGETMEINLDLSDLAGETVQFILSVTDKGKFKDANGFWFMPHIHNSYGQYDQVISWRQEGGVNDSCYDVKIYLTGRQSAEARARSCGRGAQDTGSTKLSKSELNKVLDWIDTFNSYEYEVDTPTSGTTVKEKIVFQGEGDQEAHLNDIRTMQEFMQDLYNSIIF